MENYTVREVAGILKVQQNSVLRMIKDGRINTFKVGRYHRITRETLENYINKNKTEVNNGS